MNKYDKELINSRIIEVCNHYLPGQGKREGQKRVIWGCPACGGDHFAANSERNIAGCLHPGCPVPQTKDAIGIIAYFEDLELRGGGFVQCLKKGYEILAIPEPENGSRSATANKPRSYTPGGPSAPRQREKAEGEVHPEETKSDTASRTTAVADKQSEPESATDGVAGGHRAEESTATLDPEHQRELTDRVYRAMLELCSLVERDRRFWTSRGVTEDTIQEGGFGSIWRERCHGLLASLRERFTTDELVSVPGFYMSGQGRLHTNLYGDYTLIPYYDREGYITTIEGRVPGEPEKGKPKYMAPVNAENHLYTFPRYAPEQVMAFCEGLIGAVVAAQAGIPVASIKGCRCYRTPAKQGERDLPLPELRGVDFEGRRLIYIPDLDVKPETKEEVEALAPRAARWLIEEQNGTALLARLPEGYKDLDEWLLAVHEAERVPQFAGLMPTALTPEQWEGKAPPEEANQEEEKSVPENAAGGDHAQEAEKLKKATGEVRRSVVVEESASDSQEAPKSVQAHGGSGGQGEAATPKATKVKTRPAQPRAYRPIKKTNFGEFLVALLYGVLAGVACLALLAYAAPEWKPTAFMAEVPLWVSAAVSATVAIGVVGLVCRSLYVRRWRALRDHLAGRKA